MKTQNHTSRGLSILITGLLLFCCTLIKAQAALLYPVINTKNCVVEIAYEVGYIPGCPQPCAYSGTTTVQIPANSTLWIGSPCAPGRGASYDIHVVLMSVDGIAVTSSIYLGCSVGYMGSSCIISYGSSNNGTTVSSTSCGNLWNMQYTNTATTIW